MVGQKEARTLSWLWLHHALGWRHIYFLSMGITETGKLPPSFQHTLLSDCDNHSQRNDDVDSVDTFTQCTSTTTTTANPSSTIHRNGHHLPNGSANHVTQTQTQLTSNSNSRGNTSTASKFKRFLEEKRSDDELDESEDLNSMMANASYMSYRTTFTVKSCNSLINKDGILTAMSYARYLYFYYEEHQSLIELISLYCGSLFGWKEPWIVQLPQKVLRNLKMYQKTYHYPSQSLSSDDSRADNRRYMQLHNQNNILSDCILVSTKRDGYWLGNILSGEWYELGLETPHLENLRSAVARGSMSVDLFPRSNRLYFAGGLVMGMPISTIAELDLDSMRLGPVDEMPIPRAYPSMVFFPDSLVLIGGTNCWKDVYGVVEQYDFLQQKWNRLSKLKYPRYGSGAVTIGEKYIFVTGGCDRFYPVMNAEIYDRKIKQWHSYPSMLKPAQKCHALKFKEDIYVVGAKDNTVQVFNVYEKKWRLASKLNTADAANKGAKLCTFDYKLIAMNRNDITKYEIYDEQSNRWYLTNIRNHPVSKLHPKPFMHSSDIFDWFHLGRRYW